MLKSRVGLRNISRKCGYVYQKKVNVEARLFSTNNISDRDLQLEFSNVGTFWKKAWNLVFDAEERNKYFALQNRGVLPKDAYWSPVWTYICLDNPLLKKYGVRGEDLIEGAKCSYESVNHALSSKDFYQYLRGDLQTSESRDFLSSVQSPEVFEAWCYSSKQFDDSGMTFTLKNLTVNNVAVRNLLTKIVPGDVPADTEYMTDFERAAYAEASAWLDDALKKQKGNKNGKDNSKKGVDTLDPPVENKNNTVKVNVVEPLHNTTSDTVRPITTPITVNTTNTTSTSSVDTTSSVTPSTPTITTPVAPVVPVVTTPTPVSAAPIAAPTPAVAVSPDNFSVQPATRRSARSIAPPRTGTESSALPGSSTPAVTTTSAVTAVEGHDEVYHIPPITAEGTPVQVEQHEHTTDTTHNTTQEAEEEKEEVVRAKTGYARDYELFPPGSVLAYVDVQIKADEESVVTIDGKASAGGTTIVAPQRKVRDVMWTFRACISGQVPLEWVLVDINSPRAEAFRV